MAGLGDWGIVDFKFQSDSINTRRKRKEDAGSIECFKFQSDSINTLLAKRVSGEKAALNSNLILLIPYSERSHSVPSKL